MWVFCKVLFEAPLISHLFIGFRRSVLEIKTTLWSSSTIGLIGGVALTVYVNGKKDKNKSVFTKRIMWISLAIKL